MTSALATLATLSGVSRTVSDLHDHLFDRTRVVLSGSFIGVQLIFKAHHSMSGTTPAILSDEALASIRSLTMSALNVVIFPEQPSSAWARADQLKYSYQPAASFFTKCNMHALLAGPIDTGVWSLSPNDIRPGLGVSISRD